MAATRLQARTQVDTSVFTIVPIADTTPERWLEQNLPSGAKLGYDPWLHTAEGAERLARACANAGATLVAGRAQSGRRDLDRPAGAAARARGAARSALRRRSDRAPSSTRSAPRSQACAPTRWWCPIRMPWPGPSTSAAPTSPTRRCRSPSPSCRRKAGRRSTSTAPSFRNAVRHKLEEADRGARARAPSSAISRRSARRIAPCGSTRRPAPTRCRASSARPAAR